MAAQCLGFAVIPDSMTTRYIVYPVLIVYYIKFPSVRDPLPISAIFNQMNGSDCI